jgi:hypothetical protein
MELPPDNFGPLNFDEVLSHPLPRSNSEVSRQLNQTSWLLEETLCFERYPLYLDHHSARALYPVPPLSEIDRRIQLEMWLKDESIYIISKLPSLKGYICDGSNGEGFEAESIFGARQFVYYTLFDFIKTFHWFVDNYNLLGIQESTSCGPEALAPTLRYQDLIRLKTSIFWVTIVDILPGVPLIQAWPDLDEEKKRVYATKCCEVVKKLGSLDFNSSIGMSTNETGELIGLARNRLTQRLLHPERIMVNGVQEPLGIQMWHQFKHLAPGSVRADIQHQARSLKKSNRAYGVFEEWVCLLDANLENVEFPDDEKDE